MAGTQAQNLQDNFNIDTHIIHNLAHLLYSNVNRSCCGHPSCDLSLASDHTWDVHNMIYSLIKQYNTIYTIQYIQYNTCLFTALWIGQRKEIRCSR